MAPLSRCIIIATIALGLECATAGPPLPQRSIESDGQTASLHFAAGEFSSALRYYRKALVAAGRSDALLLQARYWFNIGRIYYECTEYDSARACFSSAASQFIAAGNRADAATARLFEALTVAYAGDPARGAVMLEATAPDIAKADAVMLATAQSIVHLMAGDDDKADADIDRALELGGRRADPLGRGTAFYYKAMIAAARQHPPEARQLLDSALSWQERSPQRYRNWRTLLGRAIVEYCDTNAADAERYYLRAEKAAPDMIVFPERVLLEGCASAWKR